MSVKINIKNESTHKTFKFFVILAQCFGVFPVGGVTGKDYRSLHFKWISLKTIYTFILLFGLFIQAFLHATKLIKRPTYSAFVPVMFFGCSFLTVLSFLQLAKLWPKIIQKWTEVDGLMRSYGHPKNLRRNVNILTTVVMIAAAGEHALYLSFAIKNVPKGSNMDMIRSYFTSNYQHIFEYVPYSIWIGISFQLISSIGTFTWNYMDLFVMVISLALSERFKQIVRRVESLASAKVKIISVWMIVRQDYNRLNKLCKTVDEAISNITFLSFSNNLFFIITQLFNSLEPNNTEDIIERVYFFYSFTFLILRTVSVALYAGRIEYQSREPANILNALPCRLFNVEIERFLQQVKIDPSTLTGKGFFKVKKSLLLSITGAIVTYELILIQFHGMK